MNEHQGPLPPAIATRAQPSRRLRQRLQSPLSVVLDGREYPALDWSPGGFAIIDAERHWPAGALAQAQLHFLLQDSHWGFAVAVQACHAAADRTGFRFVAARPGQLAALDLLARSFILGHAATPDMLTAACGCSGPAPDVPPVQPARTLRRVAGFALLGLAGLGLAAVLGLSLHARFLVVHATHVAATVPAVRVSAPVAGVLNGPDLAPGTTVARDQPLFGFIDEALHAEIEMAEAELGNHTTRLEALRDHQRDAKGFFAEYKLLARAAVERAKAGLAQAEESLRLAQRDLVRMKELQASGHVAQARMDQALQKHSQARKAVLSARADLDEARANLRMVRHGRYFTGSRVDGAEPAALAEEIRRAAAAHAVQTRKLAALHDRRARLVVTSPCDCIIAQVFARTGEWVEAGGTVYSLHRRASPPALEAKVPQAQARLLAVGGPASVQLPDRAGTVAGIITAVSRLPPAEARLGLPAAIANDPAYATVAIALESETADDLAAGTPAQAAFPVDPKALLFGWLP